MPGYLNLKFLLQMKTVSANEVVKSLENIYEIIDFLPALENDHVISMQHWNDNVNTFEPGPSNVEYPGSAKRKR